MAVYLDMILHWISVGGVTLNFNLLLFCLQVYNEY